jgi:hypothetical protein
MMSRLGQIVLEDWLIKIALEDSSRGWMLGGVDGHGSRSTGLEWMEWRGMMMAELGGLKWMELRWLGG